MKTLRSAALGLALVLAPVALPSAALAAPLTYPQLVAMLRGMGYEPKELSTDPAKPKSEVQTKTAKFNVPIAFEISPSGRFIWLTIKLGDSGVSGDTAIRILQRGASIQPTQFYLTSKNELMIAMPIDNRDVTPAYLRFVIEKLDADVDSTADLWNG